MPEALLFKRAELPFKDYITPSGLTQTARTITTGISKHMGSGMEIGEDVCIHWTTLYDEIIFIHKGTMIVRTSAGELECLRFSHLLAVVLFPELKYVPLPERFMNSC